ncbi:MAG: TonB-dependent receptor [Bacteroidales bacterium]|nr:TonB-dependent receptor [Bacteroidales bacterium]
MKKIQILQRTTSFLRGCSGNAFKIIRLTIFLFIVTVFNVFGGNIVSDNTNQNLDKETDTAAVMQQKRITGTVTDANGNPMPGVNVQVEGTTIGSISDINGKYSIEGQNANNVLTFSFIGYVSQKVAVGNKVVIDVSLSEELQALEEVVVVGYGTQKKMNITGSVSAVNSEALEMRNVTKGSLALVGSMSGIALRQLSGNPGKNSAEIRIRGLGTFSGAGSSPLILVDGLESSIDNVNPNDIKSVSVLKDAASASIYGSRAANGVILVETKRGVAGAPKFSYHAYVGKSKPTMLPEMVNSWEYAELYNEALTNMGMAAKYTADDIAKFKSGTDPNYPNFNHIKYLFDTGSGVETKHGITMSGGTPGTQYMFSAGYYNQQGLVQENFGKRYDMRLNLNTKLKSNLSLNVNLSGNKYNGEEPSSLYGGGLGSIVRGALRLTNRIAGFTPDGYYGRNETLHPEADLESKSFVGNNSFNLFSNTELVWDITKDIKISGKVGYTYDNSESKTYIATFAVTPTYGITRNSLSQSWGKSDALTLQSLAEYTKSFGNHFVHLLAGYSRQRFGSQSMGAYRDDFPNNELYEISVGSTARATNSGSSSINTLLSYFGRINYSYLDKYLLEGNIRYDGSSRFPEGHRFGLFPSLSAGWRISKESFFQNAVTWVDDLKLRGSWGELGNQSVGNYPYQDLLSLGLNYPFGSIMAAGAAVTTLANKNISWETTKMTDFGFDVSVLHSKLTLTADYYLKRTIDILYNISASTMLGASPSAENAGTVENKGWDFDLSHKNSIGDFSYRVSANFSIVNNQVTKLANVTRDIAKGLFIGEPIGSTYGYVTNGVFADAADVAAAPKQPFPNLAIPGGIKYVDISGPEGVPDGVVNSAYDRSVIGKPRPKSYYGLNLYAEYKGFDLSLLLQGEGGRRSMVSLEHFYAFDNDGNIQRWEKNERWSPENPNSKAGYPALTIMSTDFYTQNPSDYWMRNATFIRLKNVTFGYTIPSRLTNKISLNNVRFYLSAENLLTMDHYYPGWDPEMATGGSDRWYPLTILTVLGVNVDF